MIRPRVSICLLATLLVSSSALPEFREGNEQDHSATSIRSSQALKSNLDAYLDKKEKEDYYENYFKNKEVPVNSVKGSQVLGNNLDAYLGKEEKEDYYRNYFKNPEVPSNGINNFELGNNQYKYGVHNLTVGYKTYQDRLLYSANIKKPSKLWRVVEENVTVKSSHGERISFIEAYDVHNDQGNAGYASIIGGGIGTTSVTIHLKSARNQALKYYVRVFGHF